MVWSPPSVNPGALGDECIACASICVHRCGDVERVGHHVARVDHLLGGERRHLQLRVVRPQQPRRLPDVGRPESCAGPIGDTGVERDADDGDVAVGHVLAARGSRANVVSPA